MPARRALWVHVAGMIVGGGRKSGSAAVTATWLGSPCPPRKRCEDNQFPSRRWGAGTGSIGVPSNRLTELEDHGRGHEN